MGNQPLAAKCNTIEEKEMSENGKLRLDLELEDLKQNPVDCVNIRYNDCKNDKGIWKGQFENFKDDLFKSKKIKFIINFPMDYPENPPKIHFENLFHPNVTPIDWHMCMPCLSEDYESSLKISRALVDAIKILKHPNPDSPLNKLASRMFVENLEEFNQRMVNSIIE